MGDKSYSTNIPIQTRGNSIVILTPIPSLAKELTRCLDIINKTKIPPGYEKTFIDSLTCNLKSVIRGLKHHCAEDNRNHRAFSDEGDYWKITFEGRERILHETDGLKYIGHLLANPGQEFWAYKLYELVHPAPVHRGWVHPPGNAEGYSEAGQDIADIDTLKDTNRELDKLTKKRDRAKEDGNLRSAKKYQQKINDINKHLPRNIRGKSRRFSSRCETARQAVCSRIRDTLKHIQTEHPSLYKHLRSSIDLGNKICYRAERSTSWIVSK